MKRKSKLSPAYRRKLRNIVRHLTEDDHTLRKIIIEDRKLRKKLEEMI
jgi:hypothetical protein